MLRDRERAQGERDRAEMGEEIRVLLVKNGWLEGRVRELEGRVAEGEARGREMEGELGVLGARVRDLQGREARLAREARDAEGEIRARSVSMAVRDSSSKMLQQITDLLNSNTNKVSGLGIP